MHWQFQDAYAEYSPDRLVLGNAAFRREISLLDQVPRTVSLQDAAGREYASAEKIEPDFYFVGLARPNRENLSWQVRAVTATVDEGTLFDSPHLRVVLEIYDPGQQLLFQREFFVYPGLAVHGLRNSLHSQVMPNCYWSCRPELSRGGFGNSTRHDIRQLESCADSVILAADLQVTECVAFTARTDYYDELVQRKDISSETEMNGNLCFAQGSDGHGLFYLQEAPPSAERRDYEPYDFRREGQELLSCSWGIPPWEVRPQTMTGYRHALGVFAAGSDRARLLREYLARRFPLSERHCGSVVNPWGCGKFPSLISEEFLQQEFRATADCGADYYQIDDSWQEGNSLGMLTRHNHRLGEQFWRVSQQRLGGTLDKVLAVAREVGVRPALWFAPSSNQEYRDYQEFSGILLDFYQRYGIDLFKIDGVLTRTHEAERNLETILRTVREKSSGAIYCNLDTTNGQRPGYFLFLEYGNIFLENRYVCHKWGRGYHPEKLLKSLWQLSHWMRLQSLQVEIPNPGDVNEEFYANYPHGDPREYPLQYWLLLAMFANPLLWFAPSLADRKTRSEFKAMLEIYRQHRPAIFAGQITPIGQEPDGKAISGFLADGGYLLLFREKGCQQEEAKLDIPVAKWEVLAGAAEISGQTVRLSDCPGCAWLRRC